MSWGECKYPRVGYRWIACTIYCGRQWLSIDISHNLLWPAMAIDRHLAQSIVADKDHRWTRFTIYYIIGYHNVYGSKISPAYWRRQQTAIDIIIYTSHNILSQAIYIDGFLPSEAIDYYCCVHYPECGYAPGTRFLFGTYYSISL